MQTIQEDRKYCKKGKDERLRYVSQIIWHLGVGDLVTIFCSGIMRTETMMERVGERVRGEELEAVRIDNPFRMLGS